MDRRGKGRRGGKLQVLLAVKVDLLGFDDTLFDGIHLAARVRQSRNSIRARGERGANLVTTQYHGNVLA